MIRSLGTPPLPNAGVAQHYFEAIYEHAATLAIALATSAGLAETPWTTPADRGTRFRGCSRVWRWDPGSSRSVTRIARLGLDAEPVSVEALFRLHRAHVERVAYETLWIHLGEQWGVDAGASVERIAVRRRGGYCFHLNGGFSELLPHARLRRRPPRRRCARPRRPGRRRSGEPSRVDGAWPSDATNPGGVWYVDVGLGDALHEPIPLLAGTYRQGPFRLTLDATPGGVGDWHLTHDAQG